MSQTKSKRYLSKNRRKQSPWLPLVLAGAGMLLFLLAVFAFRQPPAPKAVIEVNGTPSLKVDKEKVDLGDVKLGQTVQVSFQVTNVGDKPLVFSKEPYIEVKEGC